MRTLLGVSLALGLLCAGPAAALATVGGHLSVTLSFTGSCEGSGYVEVENVSGDFVVLDRQVAWSASQPVDVRVGSAPTADPGDRLLLRLFAADHDTILFESDAFAHSGDERAYVSEFNAVLDCSRVPYQVVMSDTAVAVPGAPAWLTSIGLVTVMFGLGLGVFVVRRQPKEE